MMAGVDLSSRRVAEIFKKCLIWTRDPLSDTVLQSIIGDRRYRLDEVSLRKYRDEIIDMLCELPEEFRADEIGSSFVHARMKRDGNTWTGRDELVEKLVLLGVAIGAVRFFFDRQDWASLPGRRPYFRVDVGTADD